MRQLERLKQKYKSQSELIAELGKCISSRDELIQYLNKELEKSLKENYKIWKENVEQNAQIAVLRERIAWYFRHYPHIAMYEGLHISDRLYLQLRKGGAR